MAASDTGVNLTDLETQLAAIEQQCLSSNLVIYAPQDEHAQFFNHLCQTYLAASTREH